MKYLEKEYFELITKKVDWLELLKKLGRTASPKKINERSIKVKCLFHKEQTPSLSLYVASGHFRCYGCGNDGNKFYLVLLLLKGDVTKAVNFFQKHFNIEPIYGET
jgi:DNA primase